MPELPEVETILLDLRDRLVGQGIVSVEILWPRTLAMPDLPTLQGILPGRQIVAAGRRGKYLCLELDSGQALVFHMRMTGRLEIVPHGESAITGRHVRALFQLGKGGWLVFSDPRKFGRVWLVNDVAEVVGDLGPEPLDAGFSAEQLARRIRTGRLAIKTRLLDQHAIAGLGNIYADESLFRAGIHPLRPAGSLDDEEVGRLHQAIRQVLSEAIGDRGTMLRDYRPPYGAGGAHQEHLQVYGRSEQPCDHCGHPIERIRVAQRSTHFCPRCQPSDVIILHTNDLHGRVEALARIGSLVADTRRGSPQARVLFFDSGDVEEPSCRLSSVTKGAAMHRLLSAAGCDAAVAGNGAWLRYGPGVLETHARAAAYPLLQANLRTTNGEPLPGVPPSVLLDIGGRSLGLIGLTTDAPEWATGFGVELRRPAPLVRELAAGLRREGAAAIIVLSHLGLLGDRALALELQDEVLAIIGGHSHSLLPEGEWVGMVLVAQSGQYGEHIGRIDLRPNGKGYRVTGVTVQPITEVIPPAAGVLDAVAMAEAEVASYLGEVIGELPASLDLAADRECGTAHLMVEMLRERMSAEIGLVAAGQAFTGPLPAGALRRGTLWEVCSSTANPGVVQLRGEQLAHVLAKGRDPVFAADRPHTLRGAQRGLLHVSGGSWIGDRLLVGGRPLVHDRKYRVGATDWELEPYGGYVEAEWNLKPQYDLPTILREALEEYLARHYHLGGSAG